MQQDHRKIRIECEDLEWLYVPDVQYAEYENCKRCMQLFIPYRHQWKENTKYPLIVFIPGSAWYRQEMYNSIPSYSKLAERGIVTAIVQYRESTIARYPAQLHDINAAIHFLLQRAEEFHIDIDNIYLGGNSSGGHIALMTALAKAHQLIHGNYAIKGIIAESAPTDILLCAAEKIPEWMPKEFRPTKDLLGVEEVTDNLELARQASCETYISKEIDLPQVLLLHGTMDCQVGIEHSRQLYHQLKEAGKSVSFYEIEGTDHGGPVFWTLKILDIIDSFIHI